MAVILTIRDKARRYSVFHGCKKIKADKGKIVEIRGVSAPVDAGFGVTLAFGSFCHGDCRGESGRNVALKSNMGDAGQGRVVVVC